MTEPQKALDTEAEKPPRVVSFYYEKTTSFQSFHVDGAFGGISPQLNINMAVFVERSPIPKRVDTELGADGLVAKELNRETKDGILRELQCNLVMDYRVATVVRDWLTRKLAELDSIRAKLKESET